MNTHARDELPQLPEGFQLVTDRSIAPEEIADVRQEPLTPENLAVWAKCLEQSLFVVGARESATGRLVGIGMVSGNQRHAEIVDGTVHPDFRSRGIGKVLLTQRIQFTRDEGIPYVGLSYDEDTPWLKDYYKRYGFKPVGFAMWLSESLDSLK